MEYAGGEPCPSDAAGVEATAKFLKAVNSMFERSLLGKHVRVFNSEGSTIQRMKEGFQYFVVWSLEHLQEGKCDTKHFISWQVHNNNIF